MRMRSPAAPVGGRTVGRNRRPRQPTRCRLLSYRFAMTDRALIDALTEAILAERSDALTPHFAPHGLKPPSFRWNPSDGNLFEAPLKILHAWWKTQRASGGIPPIDAADPTALSDALGYL